MNTEKSKIHTGRTGQPKWAQVTQSIRDRIIRGEWPSGERIPTYEELEKQFGVSRVTMQQVIGTLKLDGFLASKERQGLFVSRNPPHRCRIGIVLPSDESHSVFWQELIKTADRIAGETDKEFTVYRFIGKPYNSPDETLRLTRDLSEKRLAGLLFVSPPAPPNNYAALYSDTSIPKIVFNHEPIPASFVLKMDNLALVNRGIDWFEAQGCRRIAIMCLRGEPPVLRHFRQEAVRRGLYSPFCWQLSFDNGELAEQLVRLLMSLPPDSRPQGLFIGDDNLTGHAIRGIVAAGIKVPEELAVLSHCNWHEKMLDILPVKYLGYDLKRLLRRVVTTVDDFHLGRPVPPGVDIPAVFEEELQP